MTDIVATVETVFAALAPAIDVLDPALGVPLTIASKLLAGVAAAEPTALGLYASLSSSTPPTEAQLQAYLAAYDIADAKLEADIVAAGGPPG